MDKKCIDIAKKLLFFITLAVLTYAVCSKFNILDYDLYARLIQGFGVINNKSVYYNDILSYTPTNIWIDPEWMSSALIYLVAHKFSIVGLSILKFLLIYLILLSIVCFTKFLKTTKESPYNMGYYLLLIFIMINCSILAYCVRCQLFTFLIFSVWIFILELSRRGNKRLLFLLPPVMLVWLNSHGGCIAGIGILVLYIIGEFLNKKSYKEYLITLLFSLLMFFINPWGYKYISFIIKSSYLDRSWILEWQSSFTFAHIAFILFLAFAVFSYLFKIFKNKINFISIDKTKLIVLSMLIFLSLKYIKHTGLCLVGISLLMYDDMFSCYHYYMDKLRKYLKIDINDAPILLNIKNVIMYFVIWIYSVITICLYPIDSSYTKRTCDLFPVRAVEFLRINNIKGNIATLFQYGSYIAYKTYPNIKIYMDGRQEQLYSTEIFDRLMFFLAASGKKYPDFLKDYPHDIFLLENNLNIYNFFENNQKWDKIYKDEKYTIFIKRSLSHFTYKQPDSDKYIAKHMLDSYFK